MIVRLRTYYERIRSSLFWTPAAYIVFGIAFAAATTYVDTTSRLGWASPALFKATPETVSGVLQTVAVSTITVTGLVFPVMVVALQLASSQFSPRVLRGFLRDRILHHVLGIVVATFTFSMLLLASSPVQQGADPNRASPSLAVTGATVLAIISIVAIVVFIHHAARYMQVGEIIQRATEETRARIATLVPHHVGERPSVALREVALPERPSRTLRARMDGWVQQVDKSMLLDSLPAGTVARLDTRPGLFVVQDEPVLTLWLPSDSDDADADGIADEIWESFAFGTSRTMQQDVVFGIRQIVDIALRALSPAVNDPTTAYEVMVNLGAILRDLLVRDLPARVYTDEQDRTLVRPHELAHGDYVAHAFDQLRLSAARHPVAAVNLLKTIGTLVTLVRDAGLDDRLEPLLAQVDLTLAAVESHAPLPDDVEKVRRAAAEIREADPPAPPLASVESG